MVLVVVRPKSDRVQGSIEHVVIEIYNLVISVRRGPVCVVIKVSIEDHIGEIGRQEEKRKTHRAKEEQPYQGPHITIEGDKRPGE